MLRSVIMERMGRPEGGKICVGVGGYPLLVALGAKPLRFSWQYSNRPSLLISLSLPPSPAGSGVQQEQTVQRLHRRRLGEDKWSCYGN